MKNIRYILPLILMLVAGNFSSDVYSESSEEEIVYVCAGRSSTCYHRIETCRGLKTCSTDVRQVALRAAQILGRRQCKICYKKNVQENNEETSVEKK